MKAIVIGCGRVGATLARTLADEGWEVAVVELREENLIRLGADWRQPARASATAWTPTVLEEAGVEDADVLIAATDGDNTNLVIAQVATKRYGWRTWRRASRTRRAPTPTRTAGSSDLAREDGHRGARELGARGGEGGGLMFAIIVGGGKVGANVTRTLMERDHEVVLIESNAERADTLEAEFGHRVSTATAPSSTCWSGPASRVRPTSWSRSPATTRTTS